MEKLTLADIHFEVYVGRRTRAGSGEPQANIYRKSGVVHFNRAAWEAMGSPTRVEPLYDKRTRIIGFRGCGPGLAHSYPVGGKEESSMRSISAVSFIKSKNTYKWHPAWVEEGQLVLPLGTAEIEEPRESVTDSLFQSDPQPKPKQQKARERELVPA